MYHNVLAQTSQINFLQQQQQQSNNQQQPMQSQQYFCYPTNQQGGYSQNQYGQSYQQDPYGINQPQPPRSGAGNLVQPIGQQAYNGPSIMQSQAAGYGSLPGHILDQIRSYIGGSPGPIFILPNNCPSPVTAPQVPAASPSMGQGCPGIGINCPSTPIYGPASSCYPYSVAVFNPFVAPNSNNPKETSNNCGCCVRKIHGNSENQGISSSMNYDKNDNDEHHCVGGNDDTVCTRRNCPSSINLQALASQLLAIQGIIPCAATRLVLRKVPGSNVTTTMEDTMERAKRSLNGLTQEQLLTETRHAQQVNALINLHMTANPPPNVIPILTTVQLKVNVLKAHVDSSINRRVSESQGVDGAGGNQNLDPVIIALKSDQELRDLLATLRQKECEERVNLNFAPYQSQRIIAESRLSNVQNKISQVETEMERRRGAALPRSAVAQQFSDPGCGSWYGYTGDISNTSSFGGSPTGAARSTRNYDSPDPFRVQLPSPKRLNLQAHIGSPETTYERSKKTSARRASRSRKDNSDDDDCEDSPKNSARETSTEAHRCACEKSSDDESADEGKKKLGGKIIVGRDLDSTSEGDCWQHPGVSILKLSPNVVIVIDHPVDVIKRNVNCTLKKKPEAVSSKEAKNKAETEKLTEPEAPYESKSSTSVRVTEHLNDKTTVPEKSKKFKWGKNKDKNRDKTSDQGAALPPRAEERAEDQTEENYETARATEEIVSEGVDYTGKSEGPEPVREQMVRMITKIDYESSAFRAFLDTTDPPEKDKIIQERYKGSFTEDSLKSASTESTLNRMPESISIRVEDYEEAILSTTELSGEQNQSLECPLDKQVQIGSAIIHEEAGTTDQDEMNREKSRIAKSTSYSGRIHLSNASCHNDENEEAADEQDAQSRDRRENKEETGEDLISGDLSTIGNHVASFGSIIGKIAALKLQHRVGETSDSLFGESLTNSPNAINLSVGESEGSSSGTGRGHSSQNEDDTRKEIGRWKYIKFAEIEESIPNVNTREESSDLENTTYILPKIKHSVIEDKSRGEKYVVIEEPSEKRSRKLGEPYRTGRSLIIRSRLKSSQQNLSEQSGPFTLVKSPNHRDKNYLPLRIVPSKSSQKNRCKNTHELKSSDKFWIRPDSPKVDDKKVDAKEMEKLIDCRSHRENCKLLTNDSVNGARSSADSVASVVDEHVVEIHDYSKVRISSRSGTVENTDTFLSSIA